MDMFFFTTEKTPRDLDTLVEDFEASAGNFSSFYEGMDEREKFLFKSYLHDLRVKAHSPLVTTRVETTSSSLF